MIYDSENIKISDRCVIQFAQPREIDIYKKQFNYIQNILINEDIENIIQVRISEAIYNSQSELILIAEDCNGKELSTFYFNKCILSSGYYYANSIINIEISGVFRFKIKFEDNILADSFWYSTITETNKYQKKISFYNDVNDWEKIFSEKMQIIKIPVYSEFSSTFTSIFVDINNLKYRITVNCTSLATDFYVIASDKNASYSIEVTSTGAIQYISEFDFSQLQSKECIISLVQKSDGKIIAKLPVYYKFLSDGFSRENIFSFIVDGGFVPLEESIEQESEDFVSQELVNQTIYGDEYISMSFVLGTKGVPIWIAKKFSGATICSEFYINDEEFVRSQGSSPEKIDEYEDYMYNWRMKLQNTKNYIQKSPYPTMYFKPFSAINVSDYREIGNVSTTINGIVRQTAQLGVSISEIKLQYSVVENTWVDIQTFTQQEINYTHNDASLKNNSVIKYRFEVKWISPIQENITYIDLDTVNLMYKRAFGYLQSANPVFSELYAMGNNSYSDSLNISINANCDYDKYSYYICNNNANIVNDIIMNDVETILGAFANPYTVSGVNDFGVSVTYRVYKTNDKGAFTNNKVTFK